MNIANFKKVLAHIEAHPDEWDQSIYHSHCRTKHCLAGWAQILSGNKMNKMRARTDAMKYFDLMFDEKNYLFCFRRTLPDFRNFLKRAELEESTK